MIVSLPAMSCAGRACLEFKAVYEVATAVDSFQIFRSTCACMLQFGSADRGTSQLDSHKKRILRSIHVGHWVQSCRNHPVRRSKTRNFGAQKEGLCLRCGLQRSAISVLAQLMKFDITLVLRAGESVSAEALPGKLRTVDLQCTTC